MTQHLRTVMKFTHVKETSCAVHCERSCAFHYVLETKPFEDSEFDAEYTNLSNPVVVLDLWHQYQNLRKLTRERRENSRTMI